MLIREAILIVIVIVLYIFLKILKKKSKKRDNTQIAAIPIKPKQAKGFYTSPAPVQATPTAPNPPPHVVPESENHYVIDEYSNYSSKERLQITYRSTNGEITQRVVRPRAYYDDDGYKFMKAFCELRQAERTFLFSRIQPPVINISTGEIIDLAAIDCKKILIGPRGGKYTIDANGKKRAYR